MLSKIALFFVILGPTCSLRISPEDTDGITMYNFFKDGVKAHVQWNDWNMGCMDLVPILPYMRIISDSDKTRRQKVFIDVGANEGQEADAIHKAFAGRDKGDLCATRSNTEFKVFSVEASPAVYSKLRANTLSWSNSTFASFNMAMGNSDGQMEFTAYANEGSHIGCIKEEPENCIRVEVQRVDTFWQNARIADPQLPQHIFMLKIDTEGHDVEVIDSATGIMARQHIDFILFEVGFNSNIKKIARTGHHLGYMCFILAPDMMIPVNPEEGMFWYDQLDVELGWWGNGLCAPKGAQLRQLWYMFHATQPSDSPVFQFAKRFL